MCVYGHAQPLQGLPRPGQMRDFLAVAATLFTRTVFGMSAYFRYCAFGVVAWGVWCWGGGVGGAWGVGRGHACVLRCVGRGGVGGRGELWHEGGAWGVGAPVCCAVGV